MGTIVVLYVQYTTVPYAVRTRPTLSRKQLLLLEHSTYGIAPSCYIRTYRCIRMMYVSMSLLFWRAAVRLCQIGVSLPISTLPALRVKVLHVFKKCKMSDRRRSARFSLASRAASLMLLIKFSDAYKGSFVSTCSSNRCRNTVTMQATTLRSAEEQPINRQRPSKQREMILDGESTYLRELPIPAKAPPLPIVGYDSKAIYDYYDRRPWEVTWRLNSLGLPLLMWYFGLLFDKFLGIEKEESVQRKRGAELRHHLIRSVRYCKMIVLRFSCCSSFTWHTDKLAFTSKCDCILGISCIS